MLSDKQPVRDLVQSLAEFGVEHIVISPGSRNAPLTLSFTDDSRFNCHSIVDERSAGFFALGIAQQTRKPVAVCCTSGTALYNYGPAVAEAYYQRIPLIVISADRPVEWVDQGDGQTIRQKGLLDQHCRMSIELIQESRDADMDWYNKRQIGAALSAATAVVPGPVHINLPLRENLYTRRADVEETSSVIKQIESSNSLEAEQVAEISDQLNSRQRVLVLVGMLENGWRCQDILEQWSAQENVLILTETTSNLHGEWFVGCIDRLIMSFNDEDLEAFHPDVLVTMGTNIVSKKIKALLRSRRPSLHYHIDPDQAVMDTYQSLTHHVKLTPEGFLKSIGNLSGNENSDYHKSWIQRHRFNRDSHKNFVESAKYSDMSVFRDILSSIPENSVFQMGNSSVIRYVQLYDSRKDIEYFSNRGTSGIDGCTSTAAGAAEVRDVPMVLVTGDIAFFYDSNGLWNKNIPSNLKIILINNAGGGIFRIIEGPAQTDVLEEYFETTHKLRANHLADMHGLDYFSASNESELANELPKLYASDKCAILEVITPQKENDAVLKDYFSSIRKNLSS